MKVFVVVHKCQLQILQATVHGQTHLQLVQQLRFGEVELRVEAVPTEQLPDPEVAVEEEHTQV